MTLKLRFFLSYFFFAIFIAFLSIYLHANIEENTYDSLTYSIILFISILLLSLILGSLFSKSSVRLSKKLEDSNIELDKKIKQRTDELNKSLKINDKYVIRSTTDLEGNITDVSEAFCEISEYTKEELIGKPHSIVRHPNMTKEFFQNMWDTIVTGEPWSGIIQNKTKQDKSYWVKAFIEPEFDSNGAIKGYTAIRHNITSEMLLESQMKQNSAIINFANSAIGTMDFNGKFLSVNSVYTKIFGYSKDELVGRSCIDITVNRDIEKAKKILADAKELGVVSHMEKTCLDKEGHEVAVDMSLNKLPDGKTFVVVVNSLEDKKKLERINTTLAKQVEQEVKKNVLQLEAIQAEQLKHVKLSSIGLVAAGVIHEINTPLTYIKGNIEMFRYDLEEIEDSPIKERIEEDMEKIYGGITRIENIVKSMREISQISSETKKLENIYATLVTALTIVNSEVNTVSKVFINEKEFHLGMDKKELIFLSNVQKQRLEQVWIVIINNAMDELIKIEDYEKREFHISIVKEDKNIIVKFQDNAGGISNEILPVLFDPLSSTKESGGIGIGLNIAKQIVQEQDGMITAYNKDKGAVFEVTLPLEE